MTKRINFSVVLFWTFLVLVSLAGGYLVYYATNIGPWAFSDSTVYITAGINWVNGGGMGFTQVNGDFARLTHFPPGYPVLIGMTSLLVASPVDAARWINIISFTLLIFLGGWLIWRITASRLFPILYGAMILFSPFLLTPFSGVMSESSAILTGTLALLLLVLYTKTDRLTHLVLAGILSAAAVFIRYQQVAVIIAGCLFLLFASYKRWLPRIKYLALYAIFSVGPFGAWLLVDSLSAETSGVREIGLRGDPGLITQEFLARTYETVKFWFPWRSNLIPGVDAGLVRYLISGLFAMLIVLALFGFIKKRVGAFGGAPLTLLVLISATYIIVDLVFLWAAMLVSSPSPDINNRMLSPILPMLFILILGLEYLAARVFSHRLWTKAIMIMTCLLFILVFRPQAKDYVVTMHGYGEGFTSLTFTGSPFVAQIQTLANEHSIITNSHALALFFTLKEPYRTFESVNDPYLVSTVTYGDQDSAAQQVFREGCGALVIFDQNTADRFDSQSKLYFPADAYHVTDELVVIYEDSLGLIYVYPGCEQQY